MNRSAGLFTYDIDNHRYVPVEQADGIIRDMNYQPEPERPLITDDGIRKAVRAWADANNIDLIDHWQGVLTGKKMNCQRGRAKIQFNKALGFNYGCNFTLEELCGGEDD